MGDKKKEHMYILLDKRFIHIDCVQCAGWRGGGNKQMTCIRFCCGIPLPTLDSKISRNHVAGAFYDFLLGFCHPTKMQYAGRMLAIYFKNGSAIIRQQEFTVRQFQPNVITIKKY